MTTSPSPAAAAAALRMAWRAHRAALSGGLLVTSAAGGAPVAAAWLMRSILDSLAYGSRHAPLALLVLGLAGAGAVQAVMPYVSQYLAAQSGRAVQRLAAVALFTTVGDLAGLRRLEDPGYRDTLNLAQQVGQSVPGQVVSGLSSIVQAAVTLAGFTATVLVLSPLMAAILIAATMPAIIIELRLARERAATMRGMSHAERRQYFYADLLSNYAAASELRLFGLAPFFLRRMLAELASIQRASQRIDRRSLAGYATLGGLSATIAGAGLWWAVMSAAAGRLSVGDVTVFGTAVACAAAALSGIIGNAAMTYQAVLLFGSYQQVTMAEPDLPAPDRPAPVPVLRRGIDLSDVWFRYGPDKPWILRGFSLFIPAGQTVALVGLNGAGKTTLIKLLCRFYDPDRGCIRWDGADLRELDVAALRRRISAVFQEFMRYELPARENIALGALEHADQPGRLSAAAAQAGVHDVITALPDGYETLLTCNYFDLADKQDPRTGMLLSGGQWQRLALARAYLRGGRDLMILDEPSSGLDAEAEHDIYEQLRNRAAGNTTILISHRLSAARYADRIVVLAEGQIAEDGSHDALMDAGGRYARLFRLQARGFADRPTGV